MGTARGMIAAARKPLGTAEHPPGSNHNTVTSWYGFTGQWCDMSISYTVQRAGLTVDGQYGPHAAAVVKAALTAHQAPRPHSAEHLGRGHHHAAPEGAQRPRLPIRPVPGTPTGCPA
ncbi:hypothetical protein [Streptomyces sp. NPDC048106]|uniref:hypothetical protein n=1 Tax=Streptomyces sp. NPDC048106 TaxID=3155750 RepID=UPI0034539E7C